MPLWGQRAGQITIPTPVSMPLSNAQIDGSSASIPLSAHPSTYLSVRPQAQQALHTSIQPHVLPAIYQLPSIPKGWTPSCHQSIPICCCPSGCPSTHPSSATEPSALCQKQFYPLPCVHGCVSGGGGMILWVSMCTCLQVIVSVQSCVGDSVCVCVYG